MASTSGFRPGWIAPGTATASSAATATSPAEQSHPRPEPGDPTGRPAPPCAQPIRKLKTGKLALARESARGQGIANVGFRSGNTLVGDPRTFQVGAAAKRPS